MFPLHFPYRAILCAIRFQLSYNTYCFSTARMVARTRLLRYAWIACLVYSWLHCPALTGHRLKCYGFVWLHPTYNARFSIGAALTMAWRTSHFFVRPWDVFGGQHIEPQNEPGLWGAEACPSCSTRKFKYKYINQLHLNVMVLNLRHHHPSSKPHSSWWQTQKVSVDHTRNFWRYPPIFCSAVQRLMNSGFIGHGFLSCCTWIFL